MKLLIVDDMPTNLKLLRAQLEAEGHAVFEAQDGVEALELLRRQPVDGIVSDILMPRMDGYRLCHEVRNSLQFRDLPFIFHTNTYLSPGDEKLALDLGADQYLRKPAGTESILKALQDAAAGPVRRPGPQLVEADVLREYSERLVKKLGEKNVELEQAKDELQKNNADLERRVRERTAVLENANKDLDSFSHSVSHDLRAPVRAISGFSQILLSKSGSRLSDEDRRLLRIISSSAEEMGQMMESLLNLSCLGRQQLDKGLVKMTSLVQQVFDEQCDQRKGRQVDLRLGRLPDCTADPTLLKQVWVNLLSNAVKYTGKKEKAVIEVSCQQQSGENVYTIRDNGAGFDMQYAAKLFGAFQRFHDDGEFEGAGVGLSIVHRIIQRHGGRIWAESIEGEGATFSFTVALTAPTPP